MSKIETTSKVSLKPTIRISLGRRGARRALDLIHSPQGRHSLERAKRRMTPKLCLTAPPPTIPWQHAHQNPPPHSPWRHKPLAQPSYQAVLLHVQKFKINISQKQRDHLMQSKKYFSSIWRTFRWQKLSQTRKGALKTCLAAAYALSEDINGNYPKQVYQSSMNVFILLFFK